jgi:hypothetical protein
MPDDVSPRDNRDQDHAQRDRFEILCELRRVHAPEFSIDPVRRKEYAEEVEEVRGEIVAIAQRIEQLREP